MIWDLGIVLCRSKDVDLGEILVLSIILGSPGVNQAQEWAKTLNFGYTPFKEKMKILKFLQRLSLSYEGLRLLKIQLNRSIFGGGRAPQKTQMGQYQGYCIAAKAFEHL